MKIFTLELTSCSECPAYRDTDHWCTYSNKLVSEDVDVLEEIADFCELEDSD
jgi:hypothetical protein